MTSLSRPSRSSVLSSSSSSSSSPLLRGLTEEAEEKDVGLVVAIFVWIEPDWDGARRVDGRETRDSMARCGAVTFEFAW